MQRSNFNRKGRFAAVPPLIRFRRGKRQTLPARTHGSFHEGAERAPIDYLSGLAPFAYRSGNDERAEAARLPTRMDRQATHGRTNDERALVRREQRPCAGDAARLKPRWENRHRRTASTAMPNIVDMTKAPTSRPAQTLIAAG